MSGGTGQIVGAIAGAALAYFTGGLSYVALGASLGSMVGSLFNKGVNTQGPRLDDLKVQVSTYGTPVPTVYGTARVGGNVIWSTDKLEIGTTQTAGKGGSASNTSYKYYVHMAIALCYGPIQGIRKIWQDGRLIYDMSSGAPVGSALATIYNPYASLVLYNGSETQLPDPIIESWEGATNVPAYRGIAYVRMIAVECPGGRVPQFSFEVSTTATAAPTVQSFSDAPLQTSYVYGVARQTEVWHAYLTGGLYDGTLAANVVYLSAGGSAATRSIALTFALYGHLPVAVSGDGPPCLMMGGNGEMWLIRLDTGAVTALVPVNPFTGNWNGVSTATASCGFDTTTGQYVYYAPDGTNPFNFYLINGASVIMGAAWVTSTLNAGCMTIHNNTVFGVSAVSGALQISRFSGTDGSLIDVSSGGPSFANSSNEINLSRIRAADEGVYFWSPNNTSSTYQLWFIDFSSGGAVWTLLGSNVTPAYGNIATVQANSTIWANKTMAIIGPSGDSTGHHFNNYGLWLAATMTVAPATVASIITDQCTKAGLSSGQFDVSTLQDTVWGYIIANVASARDNLQPLLTAYAIDAVDEDGKVKFFKRAAITSMATVTFNELGCVDGNGQPGDPLPLARTQEIDLPSSVAVSYINPNYDYQTVTETARRITDLSRNDQQVNLAICAGADFMASVAQMLLYDAWNERNRRTAQVSRKWAYLSAGDGVTIECPAGTFLLWRLSKVTDTGTLMQWELVPADASIYTQQAIGSAGKPPLQVPALAPLTLAQIIDGPILQDADNNAGLYVAMSGYAAPFPGAELFVGPSASALVSAGTVQNEAPYGLAATVPTAWPSTSIDETNLITVNMGRFTLNSCTRDVLLASATNFAAYGANGRWEIIAFRTVNSLGGGIYTISGLLRGQRGTEWSSGLHQANDAFIMLGVAGTLRPLLDAGSVGTPKLYRAITAGRSAGSDQTYASTAEGLKCFSPVNVRKSVDASNNITLTWDRRTRLSQNWLMGIVPLGETSESYSVDFYTSSGFTTVAGTFGASSTTLTLTAAQQTAIGLTPGATAYVSVYQLSSTIGRGRAAQATV